MPAPALSIRGPHKTYNNGLTALHPLGLAEQDINLDRFPSVEQILVYHGGYHGALGAMVFAAHAGVIAGTYVRTMDQNVSLQTLVIQPLTFLGGTFYPITSLPPVWRAISHLNPIFYVIQVMRAGFDGHADLSAGAGLAVLRGMALLLTTWSLAMFRSGRRLKG
ncbi:MAG TPA: ABC transporter permease [Baekduia sp.]|nr:ABC transporter permease [Baekduia sp.]